MSTLQEFMFNRMPWYLEYQKVSTKKNCLSQAAPEKKSIKRHKLVWQIKNVGL